MSAKPKPRRVVSRVEHEVLKPTRCMIAMVHAGLIRRRPPVMGYELQFSERGELINRVPFFVT